nr:TM2 domain-containing protein [Paenibacillus agricola]
MNNIYTSNKSKTTAGILAILLGSLGVHHFYLENIGLGIVYLLFCWTGIPGIIALIEGVIYLASSEQSFNRKYRKIKPF